MEKRKKAVLIIVIIILALVILAAVFYALFKEYNIKNADESYNRLASSVASDMDETSPTSQTVPSPDIDEKSVKNPIDFDSLSEINDEVYSWIYVPDTNINYPVCQSRSDDNFYLNHDVYKNYSMAGAIYSQVCNSTSYGDRVTLLYGHNMANGSMFADLHKFSDADFFNSHRYFYIYTKDRKLTYEIVSAFVYDDRHIMNSFDFSKDEDFEEYIDAVLNPRSTTKNVREGAEIDLDDRIVTLSTCLNSGDGRYLLQGVQVKNESAE